MQILSEKSRAPFIHCGETVRGIMADVLIAAIPAATFAIWRFGSRAVSVMLVSIVTALVSEAAFDLIAKRKLRISDLSAVVTGLIVAFFMPVTVPLYVPICASAFAIVIVKCAFGGLGANIFNPALAGVVFVKLCFPGKIIAQAALYDLADGELPVEYLFEMLVGQTDGAIGEVSALLLTAGGLYLLVRGVIGWQIPVAFIGTMAALCLVFPGNVSGVSYTLYELFAGSLFLGAIFAANDPTTTPTTGLGRFIFGVGCGALTFAMRVLGGDVDGVAYAILTMNLTTGVIDRLTSARTAPAGAENAEKSGGGRV